MNYSDPRVQNLLAGEYVLGLLRGAARRRFERLVMDSRPLAAEVAAWEGRFAAWALGLKPIAPPDYLEWRLLGRVRAEARGRGERPHNRFWRTWAVAATVVLAIVVVTERLTPPAQVNAAEFALMSDAKGNPLWLISVHPEANRVDMKVVTPNPPPAG